MIRTYFRNVGIIAITESILSFKSIFIIPFLTRQLGTVNYGVWSQINAVVVLLAPFIVLGSHHGVIRYLPGRPKDQQTRQFLAWFLFLAGSCAVIFVLVFLGRVSLAQAVFGNSDEYVQFLPLAALSLSTNILLNAFRNWYRAKNNAKMHSFVNLIVSFLNALAVVAILIRDESVLQLVIYSIAADLLVLAVLLVHFFLSANFALPDFSILGPVIKFGLPLMPAGWALILLNYIDRIFLVNYFDIETIGVYGLAYSIGTLIVPFMLAPFRVMFPNSAAELYNQNDLKTLQRLYDRSAGVSWLLSVPAAIGLFILSEPLLIVFATPEFASGGPAIALISGAYMFLLLSDYFMVLLGLVHRQYLTTVSYYIALGLHVLFNFLLIPRFSILGAAASTLISFFALLGFCYMFASRYKILKTDFGFIGKILASGTIMGIVTYLFDTFVVRPLGNAIVELIIVSLFGIAVYLILLRLLKIITLDSLVRSINALRTKRSPA